MSAVQTTCLSFLGRLQDRTDTESWFDLHDRYGELLYRFGRQCGACHEEAEDIVQEVEMYLFKAMESFSYDPSKGGFRSYLRSAVVRAVRRRAARQAKREARLDPHTLVALLEDDDPGDERWEREWRLHRLRWAFRSVATEFEPVTIEAFRQHVLANRPVLEVASHLGMSKASVYQAKSRVLRRIREWVSANPIEEDAA